MTALEQRIASLDEELFSSVEAQLTSWDKRSLLALHAAVAASRTTFCYLEIGSYRGGSLQVLVRDRRCTSIMSIDPRTGRTVDNAQGTHTYDDNTTARMLALLSDVPGASIEKLSTFETSTRAMAAADLPRRPDYCFIDGEHTDDAVLCDARFCAEALGGEGVIAFHDCQFVKDGIRAFLKESWASVTFAMAFSGQVFALELGSSNILTAPVVDRAIASRWHSEAWKLASRPAHASWPFLTVWSALPWIDKAVLVTRRRLARSDLLTPKHDAIAPRRTE